MHFIEYHSAIDSQIAYLCSHWAFLSETWPGTFLHDFLSQLCRHFSLKIAVDWPTLHPSRKSAYRISLSPVPAQWRAWLPAAPCLSGSEHTRSSSLPDRREFRTSLQVAWFVAWKPVVSHCCSLPCFELESAHASLEPWWRGWLAAAELGLLTDRSLEAAMIESASQFEFLLAFVEFAGWFTGRLQRRHPRSHPTF